MRPSPANSGVPTLTLGQRYALAAVAVLARQPQDTYMPLGALAAEAGAPAPFLAKILASLVTRGLLDGRKGHYGGYRLARAAARIRLHDVLSALATRESPADRNPCAMGARACSSARPCALHDAWSSALADVRSLLESKTVADLAAEPAASPD